MYSLVLKPFKEFFPPSKHISECAGLDLLTHRPDVVQKVSERLQRLGMQEFSWHAAGNFAAVLETPDHQIIRLSAQEEPRINHPAILQPVYSFKFPAWMPWLKYQKSTDSWVKANIMRVLRVEILPKLEVDHQEEGGRKLYDALHESGYNLSDYGGSAGIDNLGNLEDGTPIVLDAGAIKPIKRATKNVDGPHLQDWFTEVETPQGMKRIWKQHAFNPVIREGLKTGAIAFEAIEKMEKTVGHVPMEHTLFLFGSSHKDAAKESDFRGRVPKRSLLPDRQNPPDSRTR